MFKNLILKVGRTRLVCALVLLLYLSLVSFISMSAPYSPMEDEIVASWKLTDIKQGNSENRGRIPSLENVREHLSLAQFTGQADIHQSQARSMLGELAVTHQLNPEYWYLYARSLQHQHQFNAALGALDKATEMTPNFPSAWLLKANIHLAQSNTIAAKNACSQIIGKVSLAVFSTCVLEVTSYQGKLEESYEQLSKLASRGSNAFNETQESFWQTQILADMALRLGRVDEANTWLAQQLVSAKLADTHISFITLWADVQMELGEYSNVLGALGDIVKQARFKDDALLIRLAMAEKKVYPVNQLSSQKARYWQQLAAQRINLRVNRQDSFHAADITKYFLFIEPSPEKALKWAKVNYQQAQLFEDKELLRVAKELASVSI